MIKKILLFLLVLLLLAQLIPRPVKNQSNGLHAMDVSTKFTVPANVNAIFKESCNDCHSNSTVYPWYSRIQPVAWWLGKHIKEGKQHLNLSEFAGYPLAKQYHKLEEVEEMIQEGEMPLKSYSLIHTRSKLDEQQKAILINWSKSARAQMEATYPRDSLVRKR